MTKAWSGSLRFFLITAGVLLVYVLGVFARQRCGIRVDIRNQSAETLGGMRVKVDAIGQRGKNYPLRDLPAGAHTRVYVQPLTESTINLEFSDARGAVHVETLVGYAEAGYCGKAVATLSPEDKIHSTSSLGCWKSWFDFI